MKERRGEHRKFDPIVVSSFARREKKTRTVLEVVYDLA